MVQCSAISVLFKSGGGCSLPISARAQSSCSRAIRTAASWHSRGSGSRYRVPSACGSLDYEGPPRPLISVPVVAVIIVAEAVCPVPCPVGPAQIRNGDTRVEPGELPRPARERRCSPSVHKIEYNVAERGVVAGAWRVEDNVSVQ